MKFSYKVHSLHDTKLPVAAKTAEGRDVVGEVPSVIVELLPEGTHRHTVTLDLVAPTDADHAAIVKAYAVGTIVDVEATPRAPVAKAVAPAKA